MSSTTLKLREYCEITVRNMRYHNNQPADIIVDDVSSIFSSESDRSKISSENPDNFISLDKVHTDYVLSLQSHNEIIKKIDQNEQLFSSFGSIPESENENGDLN